MLNMTEFEPVISLTFVYKHKFGATRAVVGGLSFSDSDIEAILFLVFPFFDHLLLLFTFLHVYLVWNFLLL